MIETTTVPAEQLRAEIEESLLRNLSMVHSLQLRDSVQTAPRVVWIDDVEAMLKACAANLAQIYAGRVIP